MAEIIRTEKLTRKFDNFTANDSIDLRVDEGEIRAIVGENGAGKSTLMNMLYGLLAPTSGRLFVRGEEVTFSTPAEAINAGLGMVHQHFKLVPSLTVAENVVLGAEEAKKWKGIPLPIIDKKQETRHVQEAADRFRLDLNAATPVKNLAIGLKQRVEILKMLYRDVDILILDEPTAVLTPQEVEEFMVTLEALKAEGKTIIIITHKLSEVMRVSDSVTVIRRGKVVAEVATAETNVQELAQLMVGRDVQLAVERVPRDVSGNPIAYHTQGLETTDSKGHTVLHDINLAVREGEILGIAGVEGNGQSELLQLITGVMSSSKGKILIGDQPATNWWPMDIRDAGVGIIPEDRYQHGLCKEMTLGDNMIAGYQDRPDVCKLGFLLQSGIAAKRDQLVEEYDIRIADPLGPVGQLSGGNAQKVIVAREFYFGPRVIIAGHPTRGVDIGSIEFIHRQILRLRDTGAAIILVSSELSEIMSLSDRIAVMYRGRIVGEIEDVDNVTTTELGLLMAGVVDHTEAVNQ